MRNDWLRLKLAGKQPDEIRKTLDKRYANLVGSVDDLNGEDVFQTFLTSYAGSIDPHTDYFTPRTAANFNLTMSLSLEGIGAVLALTEIAGSSEWFDCGFIAYSNASKTELLDVPAALIAQCGAVSEEVADAMAEGALANSNAHIALSTTGIAGPGGAVPGKPVGTVCFAWARDHHSFTERLVFSGDRHAVRQQTVAYALKGLLQFLEQ